MRILADENIPLLQPFFGGLGELVTLPGRAIDRAAVKHADIVLVRSITPVNADLLADTPVRFVGTATIGTDHIDQAALASMGIGFANAPGSNADSVVEYVISSLLWIAEREGFLLRERTVGIIGVGNVGGRLAERLSRLGVKILLCDPPRVDAEPEETQHFVDLETLLTEADVISCHVPLVREGAYPTHHLLDEKRLKSLKPDTVLVNTSRGSVVDNQALKARLKDLGDLLTIMDVFEREPELDPELISLCDLATPHIAGYSLDGKMRGSEMIYQAVCQHFGLPARQKLGGLLPEPWLKRLGFSPDADPIWTLRAAVRACYDPRDDDAALRLALRRELPAQAYDRLRREYHTRREFTTIKIKVRKKSSEMGNILTAAGFSIREA
ncbi:4-phosphoerythronate dehydrogenase [Terasakiispira papahanaumokuakeensis]|uniref:Erythronate-4-phosphate dehydrogenase n=1 Tax=Terasakiispira papahanaumokuakeensis TaxID=197479 RepID=A0A1E2VAB6_9GAMM|nr:4-phosphoerythronate dehydrogenase PdxB [Terasakiispira papahanaumokuakeensis]ODC03917.1 4-phosphoerythronate dehydrogenase [Terasakiispira papahanaumokuakeensis]